MDISTMNESILNVSFVVISAVIGGCVLLLMYIIRTLKNEDNQTTDATNKRTNVSKLLSTNQNQQQSHDQQQNSAAKLLTLTGQGSVVVNNSRKHKTGGNQESKWAQGRSSDKHNYAHPWLLTSLKGHTGQVFDMDFSSNGKYLASCAEDRTVQLWCVKDLKQKDRKSLRVNIDYDHARYVRWSPDSKAFVISRATDQTIEVYKVDKKKDNTLGLGNVSKALSYPRVHAEDSDVIGIGIACNGKFIISCSGKTDLVLWDLKGTILARIDTYLMTTWCAKISPCGRFVVASGFAPDVKVWEVVFTKTGEFQHVKRAFELSGHTSGIYDIAFDQDSSHMATVSKDGTWKLYQTNVEYHKGEDPHLKITGKYKNPNDANSRIHIALSPNAEVVAISVNSSLSFYSTRDGILDRTLDDIYANGPIEALVFDSQGLYVFTAGERHVRVFHNVTGYKTAILSAKDKLKTGNQTAATKERLEKMCGENEEFLKKIGEKPIK